MTTSTAPRLIAALLMALGTLAPGAWAAAAAHDHAAASHQGPAATPHAAPAHKRWTTDAPLRDGITAIRAALEPQLKDARQGKLAPAQYQALAQQTEAQVGHIVANCKLPEDADAALHGILAQIGEGTDAMAGKSRLSPREGVMKVAAALDTYGRRFDHPGWKPLRR